MSEKICKAEQYAENVRAMRIPTCELVQLAVQRYYNDLRDALDKEKSVQKIDGIVAGIMAMGEWMTAQGDEDANPYNNRGMLSPKDTCHTSLSSVSSFLPTRRPTRNSNRPNRLHRVSASETRR